MIRQVFVQTLDLLILADKNTEFFVNEEYFVNSFKNREIKNMASFISLEFIFWLLLLSML
ncbi:hypothetical protein EG338_05420 [Kaistella haifensis]|uniref:Uncharacterized protein n=1 Tax=Kaistella haifensis DSM 19056 TaxID=1450526 RepID=A0A246B8L7_9FLAO|nr:hypothetical protein EG338_05420 [Kaistella haifensis]OWK97776.1 hypothetical protein AP75_09460 [Kaistella haifensis DSM 19056]